MRAAAVFILAGVLGFALDLMESTNLWDYQFDPVLVVIGVVGILFVAVRSVAGAMKANARGNVQRPATSD